MTQPKTTKKIAHLLSLPLSAQIRAFVGDARKIFALPNFREKMSTFGQRSKKDAAVCLTCIGGAALAARDKRAFTALANGEGVHSPDACKAMYLGDAIRTGCLASNVPGLCEMPFQTQDAAHAARRMILDSPTFQKRGRAPWRTYLKAADLLEGVGL